jgi:hypothetical protein
MDPDNVLAEFRLEFEYALLTAGEAEQTNNPKLAAQAMHAFATAANHANTLDSWIANGGFLPKAWQKR